MVSQELSGRYKRLDRLLHRLAFSSGGLQVSLADIEDRLYSASLDKAPEPHPVFLTGLPRSGTTVLLNLLFRTGSFVSHTYRHVPFVLCPMIWNRLSGRLRTSGPPPIDRAHGDGLQVSLESAEAFEEMIWRQFWPRHYREHCIEPWSPVRHREFVSFMLNHMHKLRLLEDPDDAAGLRYLSKNNLNIARLGPIRHYFPQGVVVVPFRDPLQHAASLLQQHRRFLEMHAADSFSREYMKGIGHYDFGANFLPVNFDGWLDRDRRGDAVDPEFWLEYWTVTYRHVLSAAGDQRIYPLCYESLVREPERVLASLGNVLGLAEVRELTSQAATLRAPSGYDVSKYNIPPGRVTEARDLYQQLHDISI